MKQKIKLLFIGEKETLQAQNCSRLKKKRKEKFPEKYSIKEQIHNNK